MLRALKSKSLSIARTTGLFSLAGSTSRRCRRLLILCYHGVAIGDEELYQPEMFLPVALFERRMQLLKELGAHVLPLGEALDRLSKGTLPAQSVVITFDDGWGDFRSHALPVLQHYGFPATVYLTTYYCFFNKPIFRFAAGYLLWKRRTEVIENTRFEFLPKQLDLRSVENRSTLVNQLDLYAKLGGLSGKDKDDLVAALAEMVNVDYNTLLRERLFHLMNPEEISRIAREGVDIQLHTHHHRTPLDREKFIGEIVQNRGHIRELTDNDSCVHFCYPSGAHQPKFFPWLQAAGVKSATTCVSGFSRPGGNGLVLPRVLDQYRIPDVEFEAWVTGFAALMPRRGIRFPTVAPE